MRSNQGSRISAVIIFKGDIDMTKCLMVDPKKVRQPGKITFKDYSDERVCKRKVADEKGNYSKADFLRIYRDLLIIREFETMLIPH